MGLDMYLKANRFLRTDEDEEIKKAISNLFPEIKDLEVTSVEIEVGYWRKANQIHKWFVDVVQHGEDECEPHYVTRGQLHVLRALCFEVLGKSKYGRIKRAKELLPTSSGFFFGNEEYDEYYFNDIRETITIIDRCLELPEDWDFEYRSSW